MPNLKAISTLIRKAAPKIREAVEVAKDIAADIKVKGKTYKELGMNTTEIRKYLEKYDTNQFIWKRRQINPSKSIGRSIEEAPKNSRLRNIAAGFYKKNRKLISSENRDNLRHFRTEVDDRAPRIRVPADFRENTAAMHESFDLDAMTGDPSFVSDRSHRLALEQGMSEGMSNHLSDIQHRARLQARADSNRELGPIDRHGNVIERQQGPDDIDEFQEQWNRHEAERLRNLEQAAGVSVRQNRPNLPIRSPRNMEHASEEGFEQYIRAKYGCNPTRIPDED
jgi:DNA-binding transcriptional MerR regulator